MYKLRVKPTQFTKGKTEETIYDITKRYILNTDEKQDYHLIDIVITNLSLVETEQWKYRIQNKFCEHKDITINIISSKHNEHKDIGNYIAYIMECKTRNELPNILIMCCHFKRIAEDLIRLINIGERSYMRGDNLIKFHISFDEADINMGNISGFIKDQRTQNFINNNIIIGILFITATPSDKFWKILSKTSIFELVNTNYSEDNTFVEDLRGYRSFDEHNLITHENDTKIPLEYIKDIYANFLDNNTRKIIFCPGRIDKESHTDICLFFNKHKYCVLTMNSSFKGFEYPDGKKQTLIEFNNDHKINGELRESLVAWNKQYKTLNLAITGYCVIERGITFNTTGFNFTDVILSNYHCLTRDKIGRLVQLAGRSTGSKKYVNIINIYCTSNIKNNIIDFNKKLVEICSFNPEAFNRTDFINKGNTIPVKMEFVDIDFMNEFYNQRNGNKLKLKDAHCIIKRGIKEQKIKLYDVNNVNRFDIDKMEKIKTIRMYIKSEGDDVKMKNYRFKQFNDAFTIRKTISQSCKQAEYNLDLTYDTYVYKGYRQNKTIGWITFKINI